MKRIVAAIVLSTASTLTFAAAAGGGGCGWGQMLFDGQTGTATHVLAMTTNASTGNNTFGVTSGTNGCSANGTIKYGGKEMVNVGLFMDEFSNDVAQGDGEVLSAVAISLGVEVDDREHFKAAMQQNFDKLFPSENVTTEEVLAAMWSVMQNDETLAVYVS